MPKPGFSRVVPDGLLMDHVAEFTYAPHDRLGVLFSEDAEGYVDALANLIQTISVGGSIGASQRKGSIELSDRLKEELSNSGRLIFVDYFDQRHKEERLSEARTELKNYWEQICGELEDFRSMASVAFFGHLRREFHYVWLREDSQFTGEWYSRHEDAFHLTDKIRKRALREICDLAERYHVNQHKSTFDSWINDCATSHYRIFFEYRLYLSKETGEDYMPSVTRSSLRCLTNSPDEAIEKVVMPFIALKAVEKVKHRSDLVARVVDWTDGPGRKIFEGLREIQSDIRSERNPVKEGELLSRVDSILSSEWSQKFTIALNLVRIAVSAVNHQMDSDDAKETLRLIRSDNYRWLWSFRSPDVKGEWRKWVNRLAASPS